MNVLTNETVKMVFNLGIASLEKEEDLIISKQIIVAAFAEIIESRKIASQLRTRNFLLIAMAG